MNLPEYRRELRRAHEEYQSELEHAAKKLITTVLEIDQAFHDDPSGVNAIREVSHENRRP